MKTETEHKSAPQKSPNYPSMALDEAISEVHILYNKDGKAGAPKKVTLQHLGYKTESGPALRAISALRQFDLIIKKQGRIVPTQHAIDLLVYPNESERYLSSLRHVALKPRVYNSLWNKYPEGFPSDAALRAELIDEYNFNPKQVDGFIGDFKKTIEFAGISPSEERKDEESMPEGKQLLDQPGQHRREAETPPKSGTGKETAKQYAIPLKEGNEARIVFDRLPIEKDDLERIKKWIELFEPTLTSVKEST